MFVGEDLTYTAPVAQLHEPRAALSLPIVDQNFAASQHSAGEASHHPLASLVSAEAFALAHGCYSDQQSFKKHLQQ